MISIIFRRMETDLVRGPMLHLQEFTFLAEIQNIADASHPKDVLNVLHAIQGPTISGSATTKETASENNLNAEVQETILDDQSDKEPTMADALPVKEVKETPLASVEELHNLAGGADIKVCLLFFSYGEVR